MSEYDTALIVGAIVAAVLAWRVPNAVLWIVAMAADFAISTLYWRTGWPRAEFVGLLCDAAVCLLIYSRYRERWELVIYGLFLISVTVNIFALAGNLGVMISIPQDTLSVMLELLNWLALLFIGGMGVAQRWGAQIALALRLDRYMDRLGRSLRSPRTTAPWYKIH